METKIKKIKTNKEKKDKIKYSPDLMKDIKESMDDYKNGRYVKGSVKEIMKAIREYKDEADTICKIHKAGK